MNSANAVNGTNPTACSFCICLKNARTRVRRAMNSGVIAEGATNRVTRRLASMAIRSGSLTPDCDRSTTLRLIVFSIFCTVEPVSSATLIGGLQVVEQDGRRIRRAKDLLGDAINFLV